MNYSEWEAFVAIVGSAIGYALYYFLGVKNYLFATLPLKPVPEKFSLISVLARRMQGLVFMGLLPLGAMILFSDPNLQNYGLKFPQGREYLIWTIVGSLLAVIITFLHSRSGDSLKIYPEIRTSSWPACLIFISSGSWILFLAAYELMFRGILLLTFERWLGATFAIIITVMLYALAHIYKGVRETIAAIPFGLLLSWLTIVSHSILPALIIHVCTAFSNEYFSIYFSREYSKLKK